MSVPGPGSKKDIPMVTASPSGSQKTGQGNWNQRQVGTVSAEKHLPRPSWLPVKKSLGQMVVSYRGVFQVFLKPIANMLTSKAAKKAARVFKECDVDNTHISLKNVAKFNNEDKLVLNALVTLDRLYQRVGNIEVDLGEGRTENLLELRDQMIIRRLLSILDTDGDLPDKQTLADCEKLIDFLPDTDLDFTEANSKALKGTALAYRAIHNRDETLKQASLKIYDEIKQMHEGFSMNLTEDMETLDISWQKALGLKSDEDDF
ncbi:hypothetical protein EOPP23_10840 [Endozoicomonas sp. OPT23]|uniref:hypothetical protein n=1 Tax=Endozoicomonas sp. OPT23 TaxID=2072845 RepID=UPI00129BFBB7|nr:hypothetical protein [Endozoicomonas sp. OPT23]MRI33481.1 hypothetical protein [Endozoicomonas sp. OPT23]